jgi:L-lactate dehydrogenase (cytochrome)
VDNLSLKTTLFGQELDMPVILSPVGLTGMYARRGEVQAAKAAANKGIPFCLSTVSVCPIEEVASQSAQAIWFQLYVLKDRGFMRNALERAQAAGVTTLVFTVDMPTPGARYRDAHSGMSGPFAAQRRMLQAVTKPQWAFDVGLMGRPHDLGNISKYLGKPTHLEDYIGWLANNFDASISWKDLEWIREFWSIGRRSLTLPASRSNVKARCPTVLCMTRSRRAGQLSPPAAWRRIAPGSCWG